VCHGASLSAEIKGRKLKTTENIEILVVFCFFVMQNKAKKTLNRDQFDDPKVCTFIPPA